MVTMAAAVVIAVVVSVLPPTYEATSSFVPVRDRQRTGAEGFAGLGQAFGVGMNSLGNTASTYPAVLRSRTLIETVVTRPIRDPLTGRVTTYLDAMKIRDSRPDRHLFRAVLAFQKHLRVLSDQKSGVIYVTLDGRNPGLIMIVVNDLVAELQRYTIRTRSAVARQTREFIEHEQAETHTLLTDAEADLKQFRERNLRIGNSPQLLLEQGRLERNVRVQEEVYLALVREYEFAKLDEGRSTPLISILDAAKQPPFKTAPRRLLLLALGVGGVFLASVAASLWLTSADERPVEA